MKNCLVFIRNKKLYFDAKTVTEITTAFSESGYYFDKISYVSFDSSSEITSQLRECKDKYDNCVVVCEPAQVQIVSDYLDKLFAQSGGRERVKVISSLSSGALTYRSVIEEWNVRYGISYDKNYIKTVGAPVQKINVAIEEANKISGDTSFTVIDEYDERTIIITYSSLTPKMVADSVVRVFVGMLDEYIYALENVTLAQRLYQLLKLRRMTLSVAESFTGGGVCSKLVEVSGISEVFYEGLNTYSNQSKMDRLGVNQLTLKQSGAVSDETAYQMAEGLIKSGNCDVSIATTGIAGPKSDNTNKPVGLAYIAIGTKDGVSVYKFNFVGDRQTITKTAINHALFLAYKRLK